MVVFKLTDRLFERGMNQFTFSRIVKVNKNTVNAYYHGYAKRINVDDIEKMCEYLECSLSDLIEYIPDKKTG
jgi:putative transcriptional regulator